MREQPGVIAGVDRPRGFPSGRLRGLFCCAGLFMPADIEACIRHVGDQADNPYAL
jgi:hypothetical protein